MQPAELPAREELHAAVERSSARGIVGGDPRAGREAGYAVERRLNARTGVVCVALWRRCDTAARPKLFLNSHAVSIVQLPARSDKPVWISYTARAREPIGEHGAGDPRTHIVANQIGC